MARLASWFYKLFTVEERDDNYDGGGGVGPESPP